MRRSVFGPMTLIALASTAYATDGLRIAAWNITNYGGGSASTIATAVYGEFEGRQFAPDVILLQEIMTQSALNSLVLALNDAAGSPGDWAGAQFFAGASGGLNTALVYRDDKLDLLNSTLLWVGGTSPNHPRHIVRYDLRLDGYAADEAVFSCYPVHMKAGSGSTDQARRLLEAQRIRDNAQTLPAGQHFVVGGDFNIQNSFQQAYLELTGFQADNAGRFFDPIATPGSWNNNFTYRMIHTQDPSGNGGMDDRHDQLLVSGSMGDGIGFDYVGSFATPWNLSTWDDANHSYRCWGNDGTTFDFSIATIGNEMVGSAIAQALKIMASGGGHLPVYYDMTVPAVVGADLVIDFGVVGMGDTAELPLDVFNAGDVALWGAGGIEDLSYTLVAPVGFTVAGGPFADGAGGGVNTHTVAMDTSSAGTFSGTLFVMSNDPDTPSLAVSVIGEVEDQACLADLAEPFGVLDLVDVNVFAQGFLAGDLIADIAEPFEVLDLVDVNVFVAEFLAGCP